MKSCLDQNPCDCLKFSMVDFLKMFGKVNLGADFESKVLQKVSAVFGGLMTDTNCLVHHWSVEAFTQFAEDTVHETVVPDCMAHDNRLQVCVVAYLNKMPFVAQDGPLSPKECIRWLWRWAERCQSPSHTTTEPLHKKARTTAPTDGLMVARRTGIYQEVLDTLRICVQGLEPICTNSSRSGEASRDCITSSTEQSHNVIMTSVDKLQEGESSCVAKPQVTPMCDLNKTTSSVNLSPQLIAHLQLAQHKITSLLTEHG
ncbi:uncharacterized protein C1orf112-like isoform X2 [Mizuhopecten yessoensis]|uniref:uncharacterized protein C1orf112-like isoform X2 n=1 Tax=Mizuhopecten yessoensis TaxID=6573 RepID=UPI000B457373|nr:uncharacterized protein C1orf112-like isoform X2 [Mizuhopecten yessoensis]